MKKLTKAQIEKLRTVSIRQEVYVHLEDLQALLETIEGESTASEAREGGKPRTEITASRGEKP